MRRFALAALAVMLSPFVASSVIWAADLGAPKPAQAQEATEKPWNRTGFYVGAVGGYATTVLEAEGVNLGNGELMAGPFIGFNYRLSPDMILGLEADWVFTKISGATDVGGVALSASHQHLMTVRGRVGMPMGPALVYVTAGPAWQQTKLSVAGISDTEWQLGVAAGAGMEMELTRTLFLRLEGLHYMFPDSSDAPFSSVLDSNNQHTTVRVGLGFKLN